MTKKSSYLDENLCSKCLLELLMQEKTNHSIFSPASSHHWHSLPVLFVMNSLHRYCATRRQTPDFKSSISELSVLVLSLFVSEVCVLVFVRAFQFAGTLYPKCSKLVSTLNLNIWLETNPKTLWIYKQNCLYFIKAVCGFVYLIRACVWFLTVWIAALVRIVWNSPW